MDGRQWTDDIDRCRERNYIDGALALDLSLIAYLLSRTGLLSLVVVGPLSEECHPRKRKRPRPWRR
jgi:hypothetical protein